MPTDSLSKRAGVLVPIFALRSENDLGVGDTESVREMIDWCASHRFSLLQLLPINESGDDHSPYNAISSMALDPTTIAITPKLIPDLSAATYKEVLADSDLAALRSGPVQYRKVRSLKLRLLREAFRQFLTKHDAHNTPRANEFRDFMAVNGEWIADYSLFRMLMQLHNNLPVWEQWPLEHQNPVRARSWILSRSPDEREQFEQTMLFFAYLQWIARDQWLKLRAHAESLGVALMGDIPYGIGRYSVDVWANRSIFDLRWSCGAPAESFFKPDLFTERWGQNWGIPLYRWDRMSEEGHRWWRMRVKAMSEIFQYYRIDHVLGFYRIYAFPWKPEDNGHYTHLSYDEARGRAGGVPRFWPNDDSNSHHHYLNEQHGEALLKMVLEGSVSSLPVAEDLGMVPDYVRPSLTRLGIPGFKIPLFERNHDGSYKDSGEYQPLSVVTWATHDHEPLAALWNRWKTAPEGPHEIRSFLNWIGWKKDAPAEVTLELHSAMCRKLFAAPSRLAVLMITDLFATSQRYNVPGPMSDSNWTERLELKVSEFDAQPSLLSRVKAIEKLAVESGRASKTA